MLPLQGTWVRSLVGELTSCKVQGMDKKKDYFLLSPEKGKMRLEKWSFSHS